MSDQIKLNQEALAELRELQQETGSDLLRQLLTSYLNTTQGLLENIRQGMAQ